MLSSEAHATNLCIGPADKYFLLLQSKLTAVSSGRLPVAEWVYLTRLLASCMRTQCVGRNCSSAHAASESASETLP